MPRQIKMTCFLRPPASLNGSWRMPQSVPVDMEIDAYVSLVQTAERGLFDTFFLQDSVAVERSDALVVGEADKGANTRVTRLEPLQLMPALAAVTQSIGLIATSTTTYNEPYHVARRFLTLDHVSGGRAGWNLVTSQAEDEAANFGFPSHLEHSKRYERASEFWDVVTGLWDSWEDGALIRDKATGNYFDPERVHLLKHSGPHFKVRGPLNVARSPQGRPIVAQAGSSEPGRELAARTADVVFTAQNTLDEARAFYQDVKGRMAKYGRHPDEMKIMPGLQMVVAETQTQADEIVGQLQQYISYDIAFKDMARLSGGLDLSTFDPDGPLPELPPSNAALARQKILVDLARRENLSIRELALRFALGNGHKFIAGDGKAVADLMQEWFEGGGADGFTFILPYVPEPLENFVKFVVPELQRRGLYRTAYEGRTLRENLGLASPQNRHTQARQSAAE